MSAGDDDDGGDTGNVNVQPQAITELIAAITSAITAAVTAAGASTAGGRPPPTARKISTTINPYDTQSLDLESKEGKYLWKTATAREDGWKPIALTTDNSEALADLFKDRAGQFGLSPIINVPTTGTGVAESNPRIVAGVNYCSMDLSDLISILTEPHKLSLEQVRSFSAWFMGNETSTLTAPPDAANMIIRAVDPNVAGNLGLVNRRKILCRQQSGILDAILRNHIQRSSYTSLNPKSVLFKYKDEATGMQIDCGLVKLKLAIEIINPMLVVDHAKKEKELESLTLAQCGNNVHTFLTTLQEKRNLINASLPDKEEYPKSRFTTKMFDQLEKTTCEDFLTNVKGARSRWIRNPAAFNQATEIEELIKLYTNFVSTGAWTKANAKTAQVMALATELYKERLKNSRSKDETPRDGKKSRKNAKEGSARPGLEHWKFTFKGKNKTESGVKYDWCTDHGHKDADGKKSGMYMPSPHNHKDWLKIKMEKQTSYKERVSEKKKQGGGGNSTKPASSLSLSKSFKSALTTHVKLSDEEAEFIMDKIAKENEEAEGKD